MGLTILQALRPRQWIKNVLLFAGLVFSKNLFHGSALGRATLGFLVFCLLSSAGYLLNDILDVKEDRVHPDKSRRPIASGRLTVALGVFLSAGLLAVSLGLSLFLPPAFTAVCAAYAVLMTLYSTVLKHVVILDTLVIAVGFELRALAGACAIRVPISSWLLICTLFLALLLGFVKRRQELRLLGEEAARHRRILALYGAPLLDQLITVSTACSLMGYALYTASPETVSKFGTEKLIFTVPFMFYGVFRYLYLVHRKGMGGSPETIFWTDRPTQINAILYVGTVTLILYLG
jgi:4-hydroxybenzoate polyprenyltransferase